jgi:hypothetical protein
MSDLDRLPWFEKNEAGRLRLRADSGVPPVLDVHAHVGWSNGLGSPIDYAARPAVQYLYNYEVDQDVLDEDKHPFEAERKQLTKEMALAIVVRVHSATTHTSANLIDESERFNYRHICLLPIQGPVTSRHAEDTLRASAYDKRLIPFAGVHPWPWGPKKIATLQSLLDRGCRALKFHPEFQFIAPDNPHAMKLFAWCEAHDVPVLAHAGYTGVEPAWLRRKSEPERFRPMLRAFPKLRVLLAHTGLSRWEATLEVANEFADHVWIDVSGQPVPHIRAILDRFDRARICYGSDWPFYPLAVALARPLRATEHCPEVRPNLFYNNAATFLGMKA